MNSESEQPSPSSTTALEKNINKIRTRLWRAKKNHADQFQINRLQSDLDTAKSKFQEVRGEPQKSNAESVEETESETIGTYARSMIWDMQTGHDSPSDYENQSVIPRKLGLISECPACASGFINPFFSPVIQEFSVFVCHSCACGVFSRLPKSTTTNQTGCLRLLVWMAYFKTDRIAVCPMCQKSSMDAMSSSWHVAHDKARVFGGDNSLRNLVPVCSDCNFAMGTRSVSEFAKYLTDLGLLTSDPKLSVDVMGARFLMAAMQSGCSFS